MATALSVIALRVRAAHVNLLMDEGQDRVEAAYRGYYDRLAQVKKRHDADDTFHVNKNIHPRDRLRGKNVTPGSIRP
jgi:hypothetical protein